MAIAKVDSENRILIPNCQPGDLYEMQQVAEGRLLLVRIDNPKVAPMMKQASLDAIRKSPLRLTMSWDELQALTCEIRPFSK